MKASRNRGAGAPGGLTFAIIICLSAICLLNACVQKAQGTEKPETTEKQTDKGTPSSSAGSIVDAPLNPVVVSHIPLAGNFDAGVGIIFTGYGEKEILCYEIINGKLVELSVSRFTREISYSRGSCKVDFYYCFNSKGQSLAICPADEGKERLPSPLLCDNGTVLLTISEGKQREYREYRLALDLETGKVNDFLAAVPIRPKNNIYQDISVSSDLAWSILKSYDGNYYIFNENTGLKQATELFGTEVRSCKFLDDDVVFYSDTDNIGWCYKLSTGDRIKVIDNTERVEFLFGTYALQEKGNGRTLIALNTGQETYIKGYVYQDGDLAGLSPDNSRILFTRLLDYSDGLKIKEFVSYNIQKEELTIIPWQTDEEMISCIGWFDDERVIVFTKTNNQEQFVHLFTAP